MIERVHLTEIGWDKPLAYAASDDAPPAPTGDEVQVEIEACGVCHRDLLDRAGRFPFQRVPIVPGHEAAGRVVALGPLAKRWKLGDRVATMHRDSCGACPACRAGETSLCAGAAFVLGILADGGYASHLVAPESALYASSDALAPEEAAVLHCTFGTAFRDLVTLGGLSAGEKVLVTGANGGVGSAAIEIAARLGAEVVAVVRDERHADFVRSLGAHRVVVDAGATFHKEGFDCDLALDTVGAPTWNSALRSLRIGGRLVFVGNVVAEPVKLNLGYAITRGLTMKGGSGATPTDMQRVLELHARSPFRFVFDRVMPLSSAEEAQRLVRAGGLRGRIALVPTRGQR